jgi:hypothetical protein
MIGIGQTTRLYQFSTAVKGNHTFPAYSGELEYLPPTGTLPETCDPSHVGTDLRITSVQQFLSILNP